MCYGKEEKMQKIFMTETEGSGSFTFAKIIHKTILFSYTLRHNLHDKIIPRRALFGLAQLFLRKYIVHLTFVQQEPFQYFRILLLFQVI